jgi:hypothetical protein
MLVGLEVNTEMLLTRYRTADQNYEIRLYEIVAQLKYLGMTIINQNLI